MEFHDFSRHFKAFRSYIVSIIYNKTPIPPSPPYRSMTSQKEVFFYTKSAENRKKKSLICQQGSIFHFPLAYVLRTHLSILLFHQVQISRDANRC